MHHIAVAGVGFHVDGAAGPGAAVLAVLLGRRAVVYLDGWSHFPGDRGDACNSRWLRAVEKVRKREGNQEEGVELRCLGVESCGR